MAKVDRTNQRFSRLVVLGDTGKRDNAGQVIWKCLCDCGNTTEVRGNSLRSGATKSCGCFLKEQNSERTTTHGHTVGLKPSATYISWKAMKARCTNPEYTQYEHWGGRGIFICNRWLNSFENFLEDMGERPEGRCIDRIDNDDGYYKGNCRWATMKEQLANRRPYRKGADL